VSDDPHPLSQGLDAVLRALRPGGVAAAAGVFAGWEDIVGPTVAAHARPVTLDGDRLVVEVDDPGWATQLRYLEAGVLERLREAAGGAAIARVDVRVRRAGRGGERPR
jgi:predicted nucleic acid-binding Zn ribbon protein